MVRSRRFFGIAPHNLCNKFRLGFPWSKEESGAPSAERAGGSSDEDCGTTGERSFDNLFGAGKVDPEGERKEYRMIFAVPDVSSSAENGNATILKSLGWPWLGKSSHDRLLICDVDLDEFDKLPGPLHEVAPRGSSDVQNTDVLRVFAPGQQVIHDPAPQKT